MVYPENKTESAGHGNSDKTVHSGSMKIAMWTSKICSEYRHTSVSLEITRCQQCHRNEYCFCTDVLST